MGIVWTLTKLAPKLGLILTASRPLIRVIAAGFQKGYDDVADEKLKAHLLEFESKAEKLESKICELENRCATLTAAVYVLAGVALAALILSIVKLS